MFKQLGVKEEDKESDEEAARFVSLVPYGWFGFAFPLPEELWNMDHRLLT